MFNIPGWLGINLYCIMLLLYIDISGRKAQLHVSREFKIYRSLVWFLILSFVADTLSRLFQFESFDNIHWLIVIGTYLKYMMLPIIVPFFYRYFLYQVEGAKPKYLRYTYIFVWVLEAVVILMVLSSYFTRWALYFDEDGIYHRGTAYKVYIFIMLFMAVFVEIMVILSKKRVQEKNFKILAIFLIVPFAGASLQSMVYGLPFCQMGFSFSVLLVYVNIVSRGVNKDYLTGLNNRKIFDQYLDSFILDKEKQPFAAIMIDLDHFKAINDKLGHTTGDNALENAATILIKSVRNNDVVCRYGGDEFSIILRHSNEEILAMVIERINKNLQEFNETSGKDYILGFSIGGAVYHREKNTSAVEFLNKIDQLMYEDKKKHKVYSIKQKDENSDEKNKNL